jgi:hypothetical protein
VPEKGEGKGGGGGSGGGAWKGTRGEEDEGYRAGVVSEQFKALRDKQRILKYKAVGEHTGNCLHTTDFLCKHMHTAVFSPHKKN